MISSRLMPIRRVSRNQYTGYTNFHPLYEPVILMSSELGKKLICITTLVRFWMFQTYFILHTLLKGARAKPRWRRRSAIDLCRQKLLHPFRSYIEFCKFRRFYIYFYDRLQSCHLRGMPCGSQFKGYNKRWVIFTEL